MAAQSGKKGIRAGTYGIWWRWRQRNRRQIKPNGGPDCRITRDGGLSLSSMTQLSEFLSLLKSQNALVSPGVAPNAITLVNTSLQQMRAAILPQFMIDLYTQCGAINLGSGYIFGPQNVSRGIKHPIPDIVTINSELIGIPQMHAKTLFGRNDLFWFAFDSFGTCYMLGNTNLDILRKYDDPYRAMTDCLVAGKF